MSTPAPHHITIPKPDDWHLHLRDGAMMRAVLPYTARHFARAIVMPNLKPAVTTTAAAQAYRERILESLPQNMTFTPLMTVYLTDKTDLEDLTHGFDDGTLFAAKLYPAGATTNSDEGVTDIQAISHILERLQKIGMPLLIHGEVGTPTVDIFDREQVFIDKILIPMRRHFPELKIVLEHITTRHAVEYIVSEAQITPGKIAASITAHHMRLNRNALFEGGMTPHHFCYPIVKKESDRQAVITAATSGASMFFAGTDSAPHPRTAKENTHGAGGIFSAPNAVAIYAQLFDESKALDQLESFLSYNGAAFYGLPVNASTITLEKTTDTPASLKPILTEDGQEIIAFEAESALSWRVIEKDLPPTDR